MFVLTKAKEGIPQIDYGTLVPRFTLLTSYDFYPVTYMPLAEEAEEEGGKKPW